LDVSKPTNRSGSQDVRTVAEARETDLRQEVACLERQRDASWTYAEELERRCQTLEKDLSRLRASRSWRWTALLRRIGDRLRAARPSAEVPPGEVDPLIPPPSLLVDGSRHADDYVTVGEHFLKHFVQLGGLRSTDRVLDIGAGTGRMARPLTRYLAHGAEYYGIEIIPRAVTWAQKEITSRHPNFHFIHADIHNTAYNATGQVQATEYRFPLEDDSVDFAFATSVFTHMYPAGIQHYLNEVARVLRPGGRFLATFFLLTPESHAAMAAEESVHNFPHVLEDYRVLMLELPEAAIAFEEDQVRRMYVDSGLAVLDPVHPGLWTGHPDGKSYQDIVVARKDGGVEAS
jgi:SAM-dependent methyltransferase